MTLLIKNIRILGGARSFPEKTDVFVQNDTISAIGNFPGKKADEILDGQGAYLAPGFIDINTDSDHYLTIFDNPLQADFLKQGVTTIVGGMCGASLAPLLYGTLESVRKWGDIRCVNVGWHSMHEFLALLEKRGLGINFATLVGHSTIRRALTGENFRNLTKKELAVFKATLERALAEGAWGFSTGLSYVHSRDTSYAELKTLVSAVKEKGIYATHLRRRGEGLLDSIEETIKIRKETGVPTLISHFLPFEDSEKYYEAALEKLSKLEEERAVYFDLYPFGVSVVPLYTLLPEWAQEANIETMLQNVNDPWKRKRIVKELPTLRDKELIVGAAPHNELLIGKNIKELCTLYELSSAQEALLMLMRVTNLRAVVFIENINKEYIPQALAHPRALVATNAASVREGGVLSLLKPERAMRTFPRFLDLVHTKKLLALEEAIVKITKLPARLLGLERRGEIKEGNFADLVGFSLKEGDPNPTDIRFVVVNGGVAVKEGKVAESLKGKVLRQQG